VRSLPTAKIDTDGHGDAMTHYWQCQGSTAPGCAAANHNTTPREAVKETLLLGTWFTGGLFAPAAGPLARGLCGIGLATAPVTVPIAANLIEGATPGAPSLMSAFGIGKVEQIFEGFSVGRFANGAELAAKISTEGENTTVSALGAFNAGGPKSVAGTLGAIEKGAEAAAKQAGSSEVTIQAVAVTNPKLAEFLTKQGFSKTTVKVGSETGDALKKTIKLKKMLTEKEVNDLSARLETLSCNDPKAGSGLFTFVLLGEPAERRTAYERHFSECEYCRTALQIYRYKRDAMRVISKWEKGRKIISIAETPGSQVLKRQLGNNTAYFQPDDSGRRGTTVVVDSAGEFVSVEEQSLDEFQHLQAPSL
jgi:hypothetical protein